MNEQISLLDVDFNARLSQLTKLNDPLEALKKNIKWNEFESILQNAYESHRRRLGVKSEAGRKPFKTLLMFKVLVLQSMYDLSDDQTEYMIRDRLSFMRFLDLTMNSTVPDAKTIWNYREMLVNEGTFKELFDKFDEMLCAQGLTAKKGSLIDASIIEAPVQHNRPEENRTIKEGGVPEQWKEHPAKLRQKDCDAKWGAKHGKNYFGYKLHAAVDNKHKLIRNLVVTPANVHDSNVYGQLLEGDKNSSKDVYADSGYCGSSDPLPEGYREHVCRKGHRGHPITEAEKKINRDISHFRCRVEHVFANLKSGDGITIRCIGLVRSTARIIMGSLCCNMNRFITLTRSKRRVYCTRTA